MQWLETGGGNFSRRLTIIELVALLVTPTQTQNQHELHMFFTLLVVTLVIALTFVTLVVVKVSRTNLVIVSRHY